MLPDVPAIRQSLAVLHVTEADAVPADAAYVIVSDRHNREHVHGEVIAHKSVLLLGQGAGAPINLAGLVAKLAEVLERAGHAHVEPRGAARLAIATKLLALATATRQSAADSYDAVRRVFEAMGPTRVSQWAVLSAPARGTDQYRFGDFRYGAVESHLLLERCQRAGSDYFERHSERTRGKRCIFRETSGLKTVDVGRLSASSMPNRVYRITDDYFADLAAGEQRRFLGDLDRQQAVFGAAGLGVIPSDTIRSIAAMPQWVTVFDRQERGHGWVVPEQVYLQLSVTEPKPLAEGRAAIEDGLRIRDWGQRPLDAVVQTFCEYLTAADLMGATGKAEDALLHLVFGLDRVLGGGKGEALTEVVADRVAVVSHVVLGEGLPTLRAFVKGCYDMRSGYAHRGERGETGADSETVRRLLQLSRAVLGAASFARQQDWCQSSNAREAWVGRIDVLRAKVKAGLGLTDADVGELGLDRVRLRQDAPPLVAIDWPS